MSENAPEADRGKQPDTETVPVMIEVELDKGRTFHYRELEDILGEDTLKYMVQSELAEPIEESVKELVTKMYDNKEQLAEQVDTQND